MQKDPVTVDVRKTMQQLEAFLEGMESVADHEITWMIDERLDVVCLDAPFLPARIAKVRRPARR